MDSHPILIVGAGPTGLVLALALIKNGIGVRIIDKAHEFVVGSRGVGVMPRSLEVHNFLGTYDEIIARGQLSAEHIGRFYPIGGGRDEYRTSEIFPYSEPSDAIPIANAVLIGRDTQSIILLSHLAQHGVHVELNTELQSFEQHPDHVDVQIVKVIDGVDHHEAVRFQYVVGADGPRSIIRKTLGVSFLGETRLSENMVVGDIFIEDGFIEPSVFHIWGEAATQTLAMRASEHDKLYNFMCAGPQLDHDALASNIEELRKAFSRITGLNDIKWGETTSLSNYRWVSDISVCNTASQTPYYRPNIRMVDRFSMGRIFLAGDAAHVHSPAGAQGLNSGCLDAFNLGWKLALVVKGLAKESLLNSYTAERLPVIATMLQITTKIHRTMFTEGNQQRGWDRGGKLNQLGVNYRGSPIVIDERSPADDESSPYEIAPGSPLSAGDRAPDAHGLTDVGGVTGERLFHVFGPSHHTLLVFSQSFEDVKNFLELGGKAAKGLPLRTAVILPSSTSDFPECAADHVFVDQMGSARKNYAVEPETSTTAFLVRPDGVVGAVVVSVKGLERYFDNIAI
ncbi:hypothetical protein HGRIS_003427 [Hohenbuehelia grisea]|uniref:FAD-binding domain-containing protein n=1 Tax=Hohenbuehelia grisea TaxID=104357 RepID=A0ABR3JFE4_9AGAR